MTTQVLSYGGGVQSVAMCVLVHEGALPRPDYIVIADTGREAKSTWEYLEKHLAPYMAEVGLVVNIAPHELATVDLYAKNGQLLMPVYTATGKFSSFCSNEWKAYVKDRWLRAQGVKKHIAWIGFSLDEARRVKGEDGRRYPLMELMLTRSDCETIISNAGLPLPVKSACLMCPHRTNAEWRFIRDTYPDQWQEAIDIDEEIREADERGGVYLHKSRVPLAGADIDADDSKEVARQCGLGFCFI